MDWGDIISNALRAGVSREAAVFAIAAMGLNIQFGFTGLLNFGQVGFMAIGAYGVGISITYYGWNPVVALIVGILCCIGLALVLGLPALRLRADYLAIVTIAASEIIRTVMRSVSLREFSGGSNGINGFSRGFYAWNPFDPQIRYGFGPFRFFGEQLWLILIGWVIVLVVTLVTFALMRAPWGRVVRSVREDEDAARALGKNAYGYKVQSLIIGGVMGGLGGHGPGHRHPDGPARLLLPADHLLPLHGADPRGPGPGLDPDRGLDLLLDAPVADRQLPPRGRGQPLPGDQPHHGRRAGRPGPVHAGRCSAWPCSWCSGRRACSGTSRRWLLRCDRHG